MNIAKLLPAVLLILLLLAVPAARAQSDTAGSIAGQVAGIPGNNFRALVVIRNKATGIRTFTMSDDRGNFRLPEVAPGIYSVRVTAPATAPWQTYNVAVEIGRTTYIEPRMSVALEDYSHNQPQKRPQTGLSPAVRQNVSPQFISNLPSSSNHWSRFAGLAAGANPVVTKGNAGAPAISFRGLSPTLNNITVDGADNTLAFRGSERGAVGGGYALPHNAVSQFQVGTSNYSAAYGRAAGGIIHSITRSGGNRLHMEASFRDRDANWGAMNAFDRVMQPLPAGTRVAPTGQSVQYLNGQPIYWIDSPFNAPDRSLQFGFSAGGPIRRNKLFWFLASEYSTRGHTGMARAKEPATFFAMPSQQTLQTLGARILTSTNPIYTSCAVSPPNPTTQAACAYTAVLNQFSKILGSVPRTSRQLNLFPKIDWRLNNRIHLTAQYNYMRRNSPNGVLNGATETYGIGSFGNSRSSEDTAQAGFEYLLTPNLINTLRFQYSRDLLSELASTPTPFEQPFAANTYGHPPLVSIDRSAGFAFGTPPNQSMSQFPLETRQQVLDAVTWVHNRHTFRFGYDYNHVTDSLSGVSNEYGEYSYASVANFVADYLAPNHCDGSTTGAGTYPCYAWFRQTLGSSAWNFSTADYGAFLADDWKLAPRFTLSLGIRYDFERLPRTNAAVVNPDFPRTAYLPQDRNNFGPRAGFAWALTRSAHTVLSGGFGVYYARVSNATVYSALTSTGSPRSARSYYYRPLDIGAPPFPYVFAANETPYVNPAAPDAFRSAPNAVYFDRHFQNPEVDQASLSLQQQFGHRTAVTVSWLASFGHELPQFLDNNIDLTHVGVMHYILNFNTNPYHLGPIQAPFTAPFYYARINPAYGSVTRIISESNSRYQAGVIRLRQRITRAATLNVAYTFAHAIDDNPSTSAFASFNHVYDPTNLRLEHGNSNFDIRQRASGGIILRTPWRFTGFMRPLLDGYLLSSYGSWRTGRPYSMRTTGAVPVSECSYLQYEQYGGVYGGGANCVTDTTNAGGVILTAGVPIPAIGSGLNGSGGQPILPQIGRNTFRYPGTISLNLRAGKRTSLTDRVGIEFFAEAFNILNHPNVDNIQTVGYRITNDPTRTATAQLTYMSGLRTYKTPLSNGNYKTTLIPGPTAGFGDFTTYNNNALHSARRIQLGCKIYF
jgi:hypothetical protein